MAERGSPPVSSQRGRLLPCKILMLDNSTIIFPVAVKSFGQVLFDAVVEKFHILEADYFDLQFQDSESIPCWLDRDKPITKQVSLQDLRFRFLVKFYTPDPGLLEDELTRYLFALQVKRDLQTGALFCQEHTAVLLASFIVQAEWGDYSDDLVDQDYLSQKQLLPNQTKEIQMKIMEHHKEHFNQSAEEADYNLLDTARKVEMYGIHLHPAKDHEGISLFLAVAHTGVIVFQNCTKINAFSWAKIRKLCFKRKKFIIKLHTDGGVYNKDTVEFYFVSRNWSKTFWKKCIEHHAFFRCHCVRHIPRSRSRVVSRGSSFRYTGKTQKELIDYVRENYVSPTPFERSTSMRTMSVLSSRAGTPKTGTLNSHDLSFSAQASLAGGSRSLDHSQPGGGCDPRPAVGNLQNRVPVSPLSQNKICHTFQGRAGGQMGHFDGFVGNHASLRANTLGNGNRGDLGTCPTSDFLDPSKFMLSKETLPSSAIFASSRSTSRETAPDYYRFQQRSVDSDEPYASAHPRPHNATVGMIRDGWPPPHPGMFRQDAIPTCGEDNLPPPPPPVFEEEARRHHGRLTRDQQQDETTTTTMTAAKSYASAASITLTSNASTMSSQTEESEEEDRKKKFLADRTYYILKELLMTERTYKKDLELVTVCLRDAISDVDVIHDYLMELLFGSLTPIYECHCTLLRELEQRLALWEGRSVKAGGGGGGRSANGVGDLLLKYMSVLRWYETYFANQEELMIQLDLVMKNNQEFDRLIAGFESRRICYLPLTSFLLKPMQKLLHYKLLLEKLLTNYAADHFDVKDCRECLALVGEVVDSFSDRLRHLENRQKLTELQRDICGVDGLLHPARLFMREGCLQKLSQKGYQQRMFFLFSDMLVYTSRVTTPVLQFKVHGQMSLKGMTVEETESKMASAEFSFTIYAGNRCLMVAASSEEEKDRWMEDIQKAIAEAATRSDDPVRSIYASLKSNSSSEALEDAPDETRNASSPDHRVQQRTNATIHVCWHRSVSVGMQDHMVAIRNQLSGYLLRKFKNSNGWQKLWVVFTNFCLFFYKNFQHDFPLASLPLLGYSVGAPSEADAIHKDFVFKLQFKNHVYFFRAESEYTFERWIEVIGSVTCVARASNCSDGGASSPLPPRDFTSLEKLSV